MLRKVCTSLLLRLAICMCFCYINHRMPKLTSFHNSRYVTYSKLAANHCRLYQQIKLGLKRTQQLKACAALARPGFSFQCPHESSQLSVTSIPGVRNLDSIHIFMQAVVHIK